jgi:serine/threonine protein kinase
MTEIDIWTKWESQTVNGLFPLRRFLGKSDHSVVFLTDCEARSISQAAIKLIPADPEPETQLAHWKRIAALSHPNLVRVLDNGRCTLGGHPFLFIVMEYAEQTLAEILRHRALTFEEVREMLIPTLAALGFLHRQNLVQSRLKPPNVLVVNDQLKLASDTVRPIGDRSARSAPA